MMTNTGIRGRAVEASDDFGHMSKIGFMVFVVEGEQCLTV